MEVNALNNLEYLALAIYLNPGKSGRHYLRCLYRYRFPKVAKLRGAKGNFGASYFSPSGKYFGRLWEDHAECTVEFSTYNRPRRPGIGTLGVRYLKPKSSQWHLTPEGIRRAQQAWEKIGLSLSSMP
jgi:hypothetical protein